MRTWIHVFAVSESGRGRASSVKLNNTGHGKRAGLRGIPVDGILTPLLRLAFT